MRKYATVLILALTACADTSGGSVSGTDDFGDSSDDGLDVGTGNESASATETTGTTVSSSESGDGDTASSGDGDTASSGDGDSTSSGDGDSTSSGDGDSASSGDGDGDSTSSGDGDGDGDTGTMGSDLFPGDFCDPFIGDTCMDIGGDLECILRGEFVEGSTDIEYVFRCLFLDTFENGEYGDTCFYSHMSCRTGLYCATGSAFEDGNCSGTECCIDICTYGETCASGMECVVTIWQAVLAEYLDIYTGVGYCPEV